jgi:SWI/SNF-related matrix-associated actin-dependent regulator 1 of chromatin subfamily A
MHIATVDVAALREMAETEMDTKKRRILKSYKAEPPAGLADGVKLKDYQIVGVNWLNMMYERELSCILADEMGEFKRNKQHAI